MQTADRDQFDVQLATLCAGYNMPVTKARIAAYWSGLAKMSILQFSRCVEFALGEDGPDDLPTSKVIWKIHRQLRGGTPAVQTSAHAEDPDTLEYFANRLLLLHLTHRGGLGSTGRFVPGAAGRSGMNDCRASPELEACLKFKRELVAEFEGYVRAGDEDATPAAFYQYWLSGLRQISKVEKRTIDALTAAMEDPDALKPFAPTMAPAPGARQMELA